MKKIIYISFLIVLTLFAVSCYFNNVPVYPSAAAFHDVDDSPFLASAQSIIAMANNGEIVVAVSQEGTIAYSADHGVNWKKADQIIDAFPDGINFNAVCRGEEYFLAAGDFGKAAWSKDGKVWQAGVIGPMSPKNILSLSAGKLKGQLVFVAGGTDGRIAFALNTPQGPWFQVSFSPFGDKENEGESINAIGYGRIKNTGIFVAAGDNGKIAIMKDISGNLYGPVSIASRQPFRAVSFGNDRFIAVGDGALMKISADPASYSWKTIRDTDFGLRNYLNIDFDPSIEKFVLAASDAILGFSATGETWSATTLSNIIEQRSITAVTCTDQRIVVGFADGSIAYSN